MEKLIKNLSRVVAADPAVKAAQEGLRAHLAAISKDEDAARKVRVKIEERKKALPEAEKEYRAALEAGGDDFGGLHRHATIKVELESLEKFLADLEKRIEDGRKQSEKSEELLGRAIHNAILASEQLGDFRQMMEDKLYSMLRTRKEWLEATKGVFQSLGAASGFGDGYALDFRRMRDPLDHEGWELKHYLRLLCL